MKDNNGLQAKLVQNQMRSEGNAPAVQKARSVNAIIESQRSEFEKALGKSADVQRFMRVCITEVRKSEQLMKIAINNPSSILGAVMQMAQLGLDPALPNECYLIPYGNAAQCQIGYKGYMKLAMEAARELGAPLKILRADIIYSNDFYEVESGSNVKVTHKRPQFGEDRGIVIGYVAVSKDANGMINYFDMTVPDVQDHKKRFPPKGLMAKEENFDSYALKTVIRMLVYKHLPMSNKLSKALDFDYEVNQNEEPEEITVEVQADSAPDSGAQAVEKSEAVASSVPS